MKKQTKFICLLIACAMLVSLLCACNSTTPVDESKDSTSDAQSDESTAEESVDEEAKWKDANGKYTTGYTKDDLGNYKDTFSILCLGNGDSTYQSCDFTTGEENTVTFYGTIVDEAVEERNRLVEEEYGVKIIGVKDNNVLTTARGESMSNSGMFDAMVIRASELFTLSGEGKLARLDNLEELQLDAPWWDQNANEAFSMNGELYITTGDITMLNKIETTAILFNKDLAVEYQLGDIYDLVDSREWTFDKMIELCKKVPEDSEKQSHGLLTAYNDADDWFVGLGGTYTEKNAKDIPILSVKSDKNTNIATKYLEAFTERGSAIIMAQECPAPIWTTSFAEFYEGRVVFRLSGFSATNKMRDYAVDFGIVPIPLYDDLQEDYIAPAGDGGFVGILNTHENIEWVAKMLSIVACGAKNLVSPAYVEKTLTGRDARDPESEDMLKIIFANLKYDIGRTYNFGSITNVLTTLMSSQSTAYSSSIDSAYDAAQIALENAIASYGG